MFLGFKNLFCGFFAFQTAWQHFIFFLDLYINIFVGSLHSKPLHGLELSSFSTVPGNNFCFLDLYINIFVGSLHSIPLHGLKLLSFFFGNTCWQYQQLLSWQHFFFFFYLYINIFVISSLHSKHHQRLELTSFSTLPGNKCYHGNTSFFCSLNL